MYLPLYINAKTLWHTHKTQLRQHASSYTSNGMTTCRFIKRNATALTRNVHCQNAQNELQVKNIWWIAKSMAKQLLLPLMANNVLNVERHQHLNAANGKSGCKSGNYQNPVAIAAEIECVDRLNCDTSGWKLNRYGMKYWTTPSYRYYVLNVQPNYWCRHNEAAEQYGRFRSKSVPQFVDHHWTDCCTKCQGWWDASDGFRWINGFKLLR